MDRETICRWLGLPVAAWPPDHLALLGLPPGDHDCAVLEHHVHERLNLLRRYQLSHPEQATAAMNLLAHAFACLSEASARKNAATVQVLEKPPKSGEESTVIVRAEAKDDTLSGRATEVNWREYTPPVRSSTTPIPPTTPVPAATTPETATPTTATPIAKPAGASVALLKKVSRAARRGLVTRRAILERIQLTRQLLRAWEQAGRYLNHEKRKPVKPAECNDLNRSLNRIDEILLDYPRFLAQPGQPGYRIATMASDENPVARFREQDVEQRKALLLDWRATHTLLQGHLHYLRDCVQRQRRMFLGRWRWPVGAFIEDHLLSVTLGALGTVTLVVLLAAWWRWM